jgi:hypothetical protein
LFIQSMAVFQESLYTDHWRDFILDALNLWPPHRFCNVIALIPEH